MIGLSANEECLPLTTSKLLSAIVSEIDTQVSAMPPKERREYLEFLSDLGDAFHSLYQDQYPSIDFNHHPACGWMQSVPLEF